MVLLYRFDEVWIWLYKKAILLRDGLLYMYLYEYNFMERFLPVIGI